MAVVLFLPGVLGTHQLGQFCQFPFWRFLHEMMEETWTSNRVNHVYGFRFSRGVQTESDKLSCPHALAGGVLFSDLQFLRAQTFEDNNFLRGLKSSCPRFSRTFSSFLLLLISFSLPLLVETNVSLPVLVEIKVPGDSREASSYLQLRLLVHILFHATGGFPDFLRTKLSFFNVQPCTHNNVPVSSRLPKS